MTTIDIVIVMIVYLLCRFQVSRLEQRAFVAGVKRRASDFASHYRLAKQLIPNPVLYDRHIREYQRWILFCQRVAGYREFRTYNLYNDSCEWHQLDREKVWCYVMDQAGLVEYWR